jgi:hypothetical protein
LAQEVYRGRTYQIENTGGRDFAYVLLGCRLVKSISLKKKELLPLDNGKWLLCILSIISLHGVLAGDCFFRASKVHAQEKHGRDCKEDSGIFLVRTGINMWIINERKRMTE